MAENCTPPRGGKYSLHACLLSIVKQSETLFRQDDFELKEQHISFMCSAVATPTSHRPLKKSTCFIDVELLFLIVWSMATLASYVELGQASNCVL